MFMLYKIFFTAIKECEEKVVDQANSANSIIIEK